MPVNPLLVIVLFQHLAVLASCCFSILLFQHFAVSARCCFSK